MNNSSIKSGLRSRNKIKDSIILGLVGGLAGTAVMDISNLLIWKNKKTEALYGHLAGSMIVQSFRTHQRKNFVLGQILHMVTGSAFGIPLVYLMKLTGRDYHLVKGVLTGGLLWGILIDFGKRANLFSMKVRLTKSFYSGLLNNLLYGITAAQTIIFLADPSVFPEEQNRNIEQPLNHKKTTSYASPETAVNKTIGAYYVH